MKRINDVNPYQAGLLLVLGRPRKAADEGVWGGGGEGAGRRGDGDSNNLCVISSLYPVFVSNFAAGILISS